jgi:excisionase family DNA binding protein
VTFAVSTHTTIDAPAPVERLAYSPTELTQALGCTRQHVQNLIARGELRSVKLGRRRLIPRQVVEQFLDGAEPQDAA